MKQIQMYKVITIFALVVSGLFAGECFAEDNKKPKVKEGVYYPELLISSVMGDRDENYILEEPSAITADSKGFLYIINSKANDIRKYDRNGKFVTKWGRSGSGPGEFNFTGPLDAITTDNDDRVYVVDRGQARVQVFTENGKFITSFKTDGEWPNSIAVDDQKNIYLAFPPLVNRNVPHLIQVYSEEENYYKPQERFAFTLLWFDIKSLKRQEINSIVTGGLSYITLSEKNEVYQIFHSFPILRKYSKKEELIWERVFNIKMLPGIEERKGISLWTKEMTPDEFTRKDLKNHLFRGFSFGLGIDSKHRFIITAITQQSAILKFDYDGNLMNVYYPPKDIFYWTKDLMKKRVSPAGYLVHVGAQSFCYSQATGDAYLLVLRTGELWRISF